MFTIQIRYSFVPQTYSQTIISTSIKHFCSLILSTISAKVSLIHKTFYCLSQFIGQELKMSWNFLNIVQYIVYYTFFQNRGNLPNVQTEDLVSFSLFVMINLSGMIHTP